MALTIRNLIVLAYGNGFTLWHYRSREDSLDTVRSVNYFADAADMLAGGDMIMVTAPGGGAIVVVDDNHTADVTVSPLL